MRHDVFCIGIGLNENNAAFDAFISYQSADEAFAKKLATRIEACPFNDRRLKVFFAPWDIKPGANVIAKIEEGLAKARFFIIILSAHALQAEWPTAERAAAIYSDPSGRLGRVIPLLRQSCTIPPLLRFRNYLDFRDESRYEGELTRLLCVLTGEALPKDSTPLALQRAILQRKTDEPKSPLVSHGESWKPDQVTEEICCNLFPVKTSLPKVWSAPYLATGPVSSCFEPEVIVPPYILREKRLFTYVDLSKDGNVFKGIVEDYDLQSISSEEWCGDEAHSRWLVELLGRGLDEHCMKLGMRFDDIGVKYYYDKDVILKEVKWTPSKRWVPKELVIQYRSYYAHRALRQDFNIIGNSAFLKINTGWIFTYDGYKLVQGPLWSTLSTRFLARQRNSSNFNETRFWAWFLSADGKTIKVDYGGPKIEIDAQPLSTPIMGGVFGDYTELPKMTRGPPKVFKEDATKEDDDSDLQ